MLQLKEGSLEIDTVINIVNIPHKEHWTKFHGATSIYFQSKQPKDRNLVISEPDAPAMEITEDSS